MTTRFSIVLCPEIPELEFLPNNEEQNWDFAPQSEYLENLTEFQQELYEKLRAQNNWSDEQCYFYFTHLDVGQGFRREFLRYRGWTEEKIQEWDKECQRTNPLPDWEEGLDSTEGEQALLMHTMKETNRRRDIAKDMEEE